MPEKKPSVPHHDEKTLGDGGGRGEIDKGKRLCLWNGRGGKNKSALPTSQLGEKFWTCGVHESILKQNGKRRPGNSQRGGTKTAGSSPWTSQGGRAPRLKFPHTKCPFMKEKTVEGNPN